MSASIHSAPLMAKSMTGSYMSGGGSNAGNAAADAEFIAFMDRFGQLLNECQSLAMRALNRIPKDNELILTSEVEILSFFLFLSYNCFFIFPFC